MPVVYAANADSCGGRIESRRDPAANVPVILASVFRLFPEFSVRSKRRGASSA
jgi:hypothetical protein